MSEIEELMAQKKEIERKIREVKSISVSCGMAKLDKEHYPTQKPDEWGIYIYKQFDENLDRRSGWFSVIRSNDRQAVIDKIPALIADLQGLKEKLEGEND